ncbi:MAG TPA: acetate kinase [Candidatus Eisenbacteria bacterium]|nr:acetate kinase [Candidatus Eisenbacteria bacterium]
MYFIINSGSSSLKFKLFDKALKETAGGLVERIGLDAPFMKVAVGKAEKKIDFPEGIPDHKVALAKVFEALKAGGVDSSAIKAFGHRVVHGGEEFTAPTVITDANLKRLREYNRLAPLHNPANLAGIDSCRELLPKAANVAVFDTAFYKTVPDYAFMYALPWEYYEKHKIRKYGFHGISHRYVTEQAAKVLGKPYGKAKIVSCHLGSGSSVTAVMNGKAFDTTMGFTPLEGLTMSTRCGDIDPAIPLYMIRTFNLSEQQVDDILNKKSGLLGVSGYKDLRDVMAAAGMKTPGYAFKDKVTKEGKYRAKLAIEMFCYDVARYVGSYAALMGGADAVVFTAGIGERSDYVRDRVMSMVKLAGRPKVLVVPTNEELMIAKEAQRALR